MVLGKTYDAQNCSAARALEIVGERWSILIIRDALFRGMSHFSEFERSLGVAPNILATRLTWLIESGLMETTPVAVGAEKREYVLTEKGMEMGAVVVALTQWGDRWMAPSGPPVTYLHDECGGNARLKLMCDSCGRRLEPNEVTVRPGPGASRTKSS